MNPELVPLWHQLYYGFVAPSVTTVDFALTVSLPNRELRGAGLSEAGIDAIASMASETRSEIDRRRAELEEALLPARQVLDAFEVTNPLPDPGELFAVASDARVGVLDVEAQRIESYRIYGEATDGRGDPRRIAPVLGGSVEDWQGWLRLMKREPDAETMEIYLPRLRERLSPVDWRTLRRYLAASLGSRRTAEYSLLDCPSARDFHE